MRRCIFVVIMALRLPVAAAQDTGWRAEILLETSRGMGGAAIGDLDPASPGNEVVVVIAAGEVWQVHRARDGWRSERIHAGDGELIMCAIGDVDARHPGHEFVGVGMVRGPESLDRPGQVLMIQRDGDTWRATQIFEDSRMIPGVALGDVDGALDGPQFYACGYLRNVTQLVQDTNGFWHAKVIFVAERPLHHLISGEFDATHPGPELVTCGHSGRLIALIPAESR
jgi:hypothetical protein